MKTAENIKKVALVFFILLGLAHIISGLMFSNDYFTSTTLIINRVLDIPFAMSALIYGLATIYCGLNAEKNHKTVNIAMITFSVLILLVLIYINFLIPDKKLII